MDAQNAAQSDQTKPAGASPQRSGPESSLAVAAAAAPSPAPVSPKPDSDTAAPLVKDVRPTPDSSKAAEPRSPEDRDSDAETIVLPGKDGHSPSKVRKVRQEDKSDGDVDAGTAKVPIKRSGSSEGDKTLASSRSVEGVKKKRISGHLDRDKPPRGKDGSSGLSSAPASPPQQSQQQRQRRRRSDAHHSSSDSEYSHPKPLAKSSLRDKLKSGERLLPHKRKAPKPDSDDEADTRKARRQRTTSIGIDSGRMHRDHKFSSATKTHHENRSDSPPVPRPHRRSASTQLHLQNSNGLSQKKKRLPPPLQSTEYLSDESSASGSPHPRSSKLRSLTTPASADSQASPAKLAPHKKHLDAHGQTFLARACARGEYDVAKTRLGERPEDLNVADYAGNTPLQIAAINGCEDIVKLLIDAGCNLDCVNYDKETPLLDAVDNGHLGVVKLLLDAGVNPRKANVSGEEPIDRVSDDTENAEEIRAALLDAKKRAGERRRTSEDRHSHHDGDSHAPESPRESPANIISGSSGRRGGTVRSTKTRNDLLYMPLDDKTLRQAAGRGDEETVARILQVKEGYDDPESMVAAARGGHDLVIQLLLGLGGANPDPPPVTALQSEFATPILAAIGQENIKVVELLLEQNGFDPTRRYKGETYYEIARRRQGTNWKDEEHMLKNAYDEHKRSHKDTSKTKSPSRREREKEREDREAKRARRAEAKEEARLQKRTLSSPSRELEPRKKSTSKLNSPKDKRRSNSFTTHGDEQIQKRGPGRPRKEDRIPSINISDREVSPTMAHKQLKSKRTESDAAGVSSEGETIKPRRKLVSKGELRGEREKQRRASMASNASSLKDHPLSPHDSRHDEPSEKHRSEKLSEKYHDRTKALKRDESRDRLSVSGEGLSKRHRTSLTPDRPSNGDKDDNEVQVKRRRLDADNKERRQKHALSSDERARKSSSSQDISTKSSHKSNHKSYDDDRKSSRHDLNRRDSGRSNGSEKSIHVKSEDIDVDMPDADSIKAATDADTQALREKEEAEEKQRRLEQEEAKKKDDERKRIEAEEKKKAEQEETRRKEEDERKRKEEEKLKKEEEKRRREEEEREAERKRKVEEEADRKRKEEEEKQRREAEEKARREEEEKRRVEEEQKKKREKEEEERKQREEKERLHREQIEREAAEERKERERRERAHREEMERKRAAKEAERAAKEAEQRRIREELERLRLDKLPPLLRWLDTTPNPKLPGVAEKFKKMQGARYDTLRPEANGTAEGREQWVLNTHVALLLGEKDLSLSRYTAWERVPATELAKLTLWRVEWNLYSLVNYNVWDLGSQLPDHYEGVDPSSMSAQMKERLKKEAWERFLNTDMFFVKVSDFMYTVPNIPHLRNIRLTVEYRELMETEDEALVWRSANKWKQDPDAARYRGFAPRYKHYVNGVLDSEDLPKPAVTSKLPFPEVRVPRRGLVRVYPDDPEYARICVEQGLEHLLNGCSVSPLLNGVHSSPMSQKSPLPARPTVNGLNGVTAIPNDTATNGGLPNGINGLST